MQKPTYRFLVIIQIIISAFSIYLCQSSAYAGIFMGTSAVVPAPMPLPGKDCAPGLPCYESVLPFVAGFHAKMHNDLPMPHTLPVRVKITDPSLKVNIMRLIRQGPWKRLVWKLPYDMKWVGVATISAPSIQDVIAKVLEPYALQAVFYNANHVVVIQPREMHNVNV